MCAPWPDFTFAFQPIVNIKTQSIVSFEALVRGKNHDAAALVLGQICDADKYQFDEMLRVKAIPLAAKLGIGCNLNLNLLPGSLAVSDTAISSTLAAAKQAQIPTNQITLEITETEIINNVQWFTNVVNRYRSSGLHIAIDDFGSGYSGLNLLAEFQPDSIKIDMLLIRQIHKHGPRQAIVRGVLRTSRDLGIDVIAEGVESEAEFLWCAEEGIELFQGYFFAKPGFENLPVAFYPAR